jgi:hypothetical protein
MGICDALSHQCLHIQLSNHFWWFKETHPQTIECKFQIPNIENMKPNKMCKMKIVKI